MLNCENPSEDEVNLACWTLESHEDRVVLADSEPWSDKAKRENRQISAMFAVVLVCGAVILAWLFNWLIWRWL
jgi:hypothetical protein